MAEIRSTLDMVLERAAKMAEEAPEASDSEELVKKGMRLAAEFLAQDSGDIAEVLSSQPKTDQVALRKGMAKTLLRNIVLPRDEDLVKSSRLAISGVLALAGKSGEIKAICGELDQILQQYGQHKEQMTQQLNEAIKAQLSQQLMAEGRGDVENIDPRMHPQYREEVEKMLTNLNGQYNDAMDQRKQSILERLS